MYDPTARRRLGRTSLQVTQFGFGTAPLAGFRTTIPELDAISTVDAAYQAGVRLFDSSPYYGYGRAELRMGAALRDRPRDDLVVSTKIGRWMTPVPRGTTIEGMRRGGLNYYPTFDYSYDGVHRSLEQSLLRTGLDRVDILLVHDVDFWTTGDRMVLEDRFRDVMDGAHRALVDLRSQGVIGAIGVGLNEADMSARFVRAGDFDCVLLAGRYTLLEQKALDDFMPLCEKRNVSVILGGPLNSGVLATGARQGAKYDYSDAPKWVMNRVARIEEVCIRHGVPLAAAALQFPLAHPAIASIIPGAVSKEEMLGNFGLLRHPIPAALWEELRQLRLLDPRAPVPA
ncbi:MAG: aldo/keto reductase [Alphaproteobacteria bacterium]|nr:aldo/keto reductase [Alphaproteobacteria bacterium]